MDNTSRSDTNGVQIVVPGDRLGNIDEYAPGPGTYARGRYVHASILGSHRILQGNEEDTPVAVVESVSDSTHNKVVEVGNIVIGRVTRTTNRNANIEIICVEDIILKQPYGGVINKEDVRSMEIDKVRIQDCFRPGDLVRARVISLGDARQYYLSTAEPALGVRWARARSGRGLLVPVSWQEMECPETHEREPRKCARPETSLSSTKTTR